MGEEKGPEFYDDTFDGADHWKRPYWQSPYYPIWAVISDRMRRTPGGVPTVLDLGCGPGQFAACVSHLTGAMHCQGVDFSRKRIEHAAALGIRGWSFACVDVFEWLSFQNGPRFGAWTAIEFLEHVERDLDVISSCPPGTRMFFTVPSYDYDSHVRHFASAGSVAARYGEYFSELDILPMKIGGGTIWVCEGERA